MWRLVTGLRPLGWLGVLVALVGTETIRVAAPRAAWSLVALGAGLVFLGAAIVLRGRRPREG